MFVNLFRKDCGDYYRYWASVSTKKYDKKKKKEIDKYINATIPVRLIPDMESLFGDVAKDTKNKKIGHALFENVVGFFEAVEPNEGDPFVRFVIMEMEPVEDDEDDEPAAKKKTAKKKTAKKKAEDEDEDEDE